jgi:hypothetical protein
MLIADRNVVALPERVKLSPGQEQDALRHQAARQRDLVWRIVRLGAVNSSRSLHPDHGIARPPVGQVG